MDQLVPPGPGHDRPLAVMMVLGTNNPIAPLKTSSNLDHVQTQHLNPTVAKDQSLQLPPCTNLIHSLEPLGDPSVRQGCSRH
jgi:hypothetical protein